MAGTKTAPLWITQLDFAKDMSKPAWEIFGGSPVLWWYRWKVYRDIMLEVKELNNG